MKKMTCRELGGACDLEFTADTFEELAELSKQHGMAMFQSGDQAHLEAISKVMALMNEPEKMAQWIAEKKELFDSIPEE